jgi:hypothetical protein
VVGGVVKSAPVIKAESRSFTTCGPARTAAAIPIRLPTPVALPKEKIGSGPCCPPCWRVPDVAEGPADGG